MGRIQGFPLPSLGMKYSILQFRGVQLSHVCDVLQVVAVYWQIIVRYRQVRNWAVSSLSEPAQDPTGKLDLVSGRFAARIIS